MKNVILRFAVCTWKQMKIVLFILGVAQVCLFLLLFSNPVRNILISSPSWRGLSSFQILKIKQSINSFPFPATPSVECFGNASNVSNKEISAKARIIRKGQAQNLNHPRSTVEEVIKLSRELLTPRVEDVQMHANAHRWVNATSERRAKYGRYLPIMSLEDKALLFRTWRVLDIACRAANISYFLVEGTLLGTYRHGGIIPWDDDIDVAFHVRDANRIRQALSCLPGYTLRVQGNMHWKFFPANGKEIPGFCPHEENHANVTYAMVSYSRPEMMSPEPSVATSCRTAVPRYPFVDIFLLTSDDSYTWTLTEYFLSYMVYQNDDIFPLSYVTFEGFLAPVPRRTAVVLGVIYDLDICFSPFHNHRLNKGLDSDEIVSVPCRELSGMYRMLHI